ncbi:signal recognition particle-docking protein FtsY [Aquibium oceanicum]|uniref:Signal recognition particle receptor FtsY n=1 Tax=Aquibium oceanicum TaxID=1670800 RepID=A0A1L3SKR3_9HYPH|nr:signal recognition particle-docking protein FtsY [Aquibium oceanicum]APH69935.1 signal recognition particle-docking protein FtsY [Aquibium oceanicum]
MAFGFIKKVFSFGKNKVEETPAEGQTPPPEATAHQIPAPLEGEGESRLAGSPLTSSEEATTEGDAPAAPVGPEAPAAEIERPCANHRRSQATRFWMTSAPEPDAIVTPLERPADEPTEAVKPEVERKNQPPAEEKTADKTPEPAPEQPPASPPASEILPPLRAPSPVRPDPLADDVAPEPEAAPKPAASGGEPPRGRVTVGKAVERKSEAAPAPAEPQPRPNWLQRLREGLSRSSKELSGNISGVFTKRRLDEDTLQDLEDVLIRADLGMETAIRITDSLASGRYGRDVSDLEVRTVMAQEVEKVLGPVAQPLELDLSHKPHVVLVVGVNGTGKTTTIGKLAAKLTAGGLSVMLAAGDTFRAAAIEQLKIWGERTNSPVVSSKLGADAAGLAWDAYEKAKEAGADVLIIDTAGRLQNKAELMAELEKIVRVLGKLDPEAPHTVLQTVDATTGQNALNQVEIFRNVAGVNGLVMTKLDGTARGGILVAIAAKHKLPVYFIGVGEQVDDLEPFSAGDFAKAIAGVA